MRETSHVTTKLSVPRRIAAALRGPSQFALRGKNALITGGTRGLGLEIARVLVRKGSNVALVARDPAELARAVEELQQSQVRVVGETCDLRDGASIDAMLKAVQSKLGPIDVLVNNAGLIQVGPLDAMTLNDFEQALLLHCLAPLRTMLGLRETMRARGGGRIVNISSVGGLLAVPHLLPYSASKFALVGLSEGMHTELAADNIVVSTIAPGLMRTGSPRQALFKGNRQAEHAWFTISDSLPILSMSSGRSARCIVRAIEHGTPHVVLGMPAKLAAFAHAVAPNFVARALTLANALLPTGDDPIARKGYDSESSWAPSVLTTLTERAATLNNER